MSNKTDELLKKAKAMKNPDFVDAIEALEFLDDEASANHQEYKDLEELVDQRKMLIKILPDESKESKTTKKDTKLNYKGIRMIGSFWYSKSDGYKKSFSTADECAKNFNGK